MAFDFSDELKKTVKTLGDLCAVEAVYTPKDGGFSRFVNVIPASSDYEVEDQFGFKVGGVATDFILVCDFEPKIGDKIRIGKTVYELYDFGGNGCWRWSDGYKTAKRLHAREVS